MAGIRPIRELFRELHEPDSATVRFECKLCDYTYWEPAGATGWAVSLQGLFMLVKHLRGHTST
jgi:hypothetical protein